MDKNVLLDNLKGNYYPYDIAIQLAYKLVKESNNQKNSYLENFVNSTIPNEELLLKLNSCDFSIVDIQNLFEASIDSLEKKENGVVYTPEYIVDYIIDNTIDLDGIENMIVVDPACGCGAFLTGLIGKLSHIESVDLCDFISNNLFGFDLNESCKKDIELVINVQLLTLNKCHSDVKINVHSFDSLFNEWGKYLPRKPDYVIGNPPYVKVQTMKKDYVEKLKNSFDTTKNGGFNLFYAFIEKSMCELSDNGKLGFIIPNNFLKIKSGMCLRKYISKNNYLEKIVDFDCNMIFAPVMTYNCITVLSKSGTSNVTYAVLEKTNDIQSELKNVEYKSIDANSLDDDGWLLLPESVKKKIEKIERFENKIGDQIKTGIATLRDKLYTIDIVNDGKYYKKFNDEIFEIEKEALRPLYKVSDISDVNNIKKDVKFIIFPYDDNRNRPKPIPENDIGEKFPLTKKYFDVIKSLLDERNKFKVSAFYEYGRSQGINNFGKKLMFSQFLGKPKFILCEDDLALLCNGFAIYENSIIDIRCLQKIIQSPVMDFYISNTSYSIEGGFHCYQKKYLKDFSYPTLSKEQEKWIIEEQDIEKINDFITKLYFD